ncbi:MAG: helix-turn-helix domain-containing protein [Thaumarchaeota archaeon]|nr:helix-turn-helix domain-containing protein [Nitrososphaerota archaeon]
MQLGKADSVRLYKIRKAISELSNKEGRGTELVSLYIPSRKPIHEVIAYLRDEWGTAGNIKSDTTRNHVQDALTKTMQRLKLYKETPENGLVIFSGALPTNGPGSEVVRINEIVPPKPVSTFLYTCDDHYHLEQLRDMLKEEKVYGILAIDSTEAGIGILSGDRLDIEDVLTSGVSGKTRKGGQCVSSDTILQLEDGRLAPVSYVSARSRIASYNFGNYTHGIYECTDTFSLVPKEYYVIETMRPKFNVSATAEHRFFTLASEGICTVEASKLKAGQKILISRRLPEPTNPILLTRFPANYRYLLSRNGRELLKELRIEKGMSQAKLARANGLHQTEISQLERGERDLKWEKLQKIIHFLHGNVDKFLADHVETKRTLPEQFNNELLQLLGYIAGDGSVDGNRVKLYEYRNQVAKMYANLARLSLNLQYVPIQKVDKTGRPGSFAKHRYLETRIYCKEFADALRQYYPGLISTESREIPEQIQRLDNEHLAHFLRGLFDAEGHVRKQRRIGIAMKAGLLMRQLQLLLLRFGIVSSYSTRINRYGSLMHGLDISDYNSLEVFYKHIRFSAKEKQDRLRCGIEQRQVHSYLSVPVIGSWVDKRAKELAIRRRQFSGITNFFHDERGISRPVFRRVVHTFEEELTRARSSDASNEKLQLLEETLSRLSMIERSELILVRVKKVRRMKNLGKEKFIDIELPTTRSFIGNGFVLHNSARRYERLRDMELTYYYNRIGEHATRILVNDHHVAGIIVGGPGPTKEDFLKGGYLHYQLQKNVLAILDTGYSGREGVREMVDKASDTLHDVRLVEEKKLVQRFLSEVNKHGGLAIYGLPRIFEAISKANVEIVLVSDDVATTEIRLTCKNCKTAQERVVPNQKRMQTMQEMISRPCEKCGSTDYETDETDVIDVLEERALQVGAKVEVISSGTEEGNMFKSFGGVGAFLRYRT